MKVLVTAVSGQLGAAIAKRAINEFGIENVIGTARNSENAGKLGIKIYKADYNSKDDFIKAMNGVDAVLLVSGMSAPKERIEQHRNVINAAFESGVKKIVYTSIIGLPGNTTFDPIIDSNRQTETDIQASGLEFAIGRNGLYLEPDIEFLGNYVKEGMIANCAGEGKCSYTTRDELAVAYVNLLKRNDLNGGTYELVGESITQTELVGFFNKYYKTELIYKSLSTDEYLEWQYKHNGKFLGAIIAGIYTKIRNNEFNINSDFETVTGQKHKSIVDIFRKYSTNK